MKSPASDARNLNRFLTAIFSLGLILSSTGCQRAILSNESVPSNSADTAMKTIENQAEISVDFSVRNGLIRHPLHCSGYMPNISAQNIYDFSPQFTELHFLNSRTHDQALTNAGQRVVDTHFVFPIITADPTDPDNYYFAATDHLFEACLACGTGILYRLGTSIEHTKGRHFNTDVPADFEHYAEVLAGIVRHYNHGWANGFHWGIEYWEIWNEPNLGSRMWDGTMEEYYRFYEVVAKRLKKEFPEIKVGGPAYAGYAESSMIELLNHCRENNVPIDFLSWHGYTSEVDRLVSQPLRARNLLDSMGFTETETMINEWHYLLSWDGLHSNVTPEKYKNALSGPTGHFGIDSAAFNVSVIIGWHDTPLDWAYYYGCGDGNWGFVDRFRKLNKNYYSMYMVGQMVTRFPHRVVAECPVDTISVLAGEDDAGNCGILIADYRGSTEEIRLEIDGVGEFHDVVVQLLDDASDLLEVEAQVFGGSLILHKQEPGSAVFFVTLHKDTGHAVSGR